MIASILALDTHMLAILFAGRDAGVVLFMANVSMFGEWTIILPLTVTIAGALLIGKHRADAIGLMTTVFGSCIFVVALKYVVARPRPDLIFRAISETGYSFPSAHAALSIAFFGFICYLLFERTKNTQLRQLAVILATVLSLVIGFSRLYLGVHYLSDVAAGFAIGGLFLWLGVAATKLFMRREAISAVPS